MGLNPRLVGQVFRLASALKHDPFICLNPRLVGQVFRQDEGLIVANDCEVLIPD